ncbi:hypothetical protein BCR34DRAFT_143413 [Clohesyomyces aquaticus]|uniref:Uncharacterized protein n=1 Tax=Clohesyomyces aquaticus TaxID=1231657 RepID=A0A1Y2A089_9PLEO|nr:hypothetical protein BCR34DRAFT_143413 [Clohesyomyces aquaticus]
MFSRPGVANPHWVALSCPAHLYPPCFWINCLPYTVMASSLVLMASKLSLWGTQSLECLIAFSIALNCFFWYTSFCSRMQMPPYHGALDKCRRWRVTSELAR